MKCILKEVHNMNTNKLIVKECRAFEIGGVEYLSEEKDILIHIKVFSGVT